MNGRMTYRCLCNACGAVALMSFLYSCQFRPVNMDYYDGCSIWVAVDWSSFIQEQPTGMSVYCYPKDGSGQEPYIYRSNTTSGVMVRLPVGHYDLLVFNQSVDEFGSMHFEGMDKYMTATAVLEPLGDGHYDPEWLAIGTLEDLNVTLEDFNANRSITLSPRNVIYNVSVEIKVQGINNSEKISCKIDGMARKYNMADGGQSSSATHLLNSWGKECDKDNPASGVVFTSFHSFGLPDSFSSKPEDCILDVSFLLVDNKTGCRFSIPAGDRFITDKEAHRMALTLDEGITLPDVEREEGGFSAEVKDWEEEQQVDVPMN